MVAVPMFLPKRRSISVWFEDQPDLPIAARIPLLPVNFWFALGHRVALLLDPAVAVIFPVGWCLKAFLDFAER